MNSCHKPHCVNVHPSTDNEALGLVWFCSISVLSEPILVFQYFFINFRDQKIHLLKYYQCPSQEVWVLTNNYLQILKLVLQNSGEIQSYMLKILFWYSLKSCFDTAWNIVLKFIYRVYPWIHVTLWSEIWPNVVQIKSQTKEEKNFKNKVNI